MIDFIINFFYYLNMKSLFKKSIVAMSVFFLAACGATNDKGYQLWSKSLREGSNILYCYYVKVNDESTTYYDAFAYIPAGQGGYWPGYANFKYVDGEETITTIESSVYNQKLKDVKNGTLKGSYGKIVDNRA